MNVSRSIASLLCILAGARVSAADEPEPKTAEPKTNMKELLRARIAEDAKKKTTATPAPAPAKSEKTEASAPAPAPASPTTPPAPAAETSAKTAQPPPATVMPKIEVKKDRITVLDQKLAKQEQEIAREKKNTKSTEVDTALNDAKIARPLAIFGGDSAQFRKRVASERVELMEAEKDVIEAIARAKTKKEKEELQKQLDELRAMRRELDKSLR